MARSRSHDRDLVGLSQIREIDEGVSFAGDAFVQFDDRLGDRWTLLRASARSAETTSSMLCKSSKPSGWLIPASREELTASRFCPERKMARVRAIERNAEAQSEISFEDKLCCNRRDERALC